VTSADRWRETKLRQSARGKSSPIFVFCSEPKGRLSRSGYYISSSTFSTKKKKKFFPNTFVASQRFAHTELQRRNREGGRQGVVRQTLVLPACTRVQSGRKTRSAPHSNSGVNFAPQRGVGIAQWAPCTLILSEQRSRGGGFVSRLAYGHKAPWAFSVRRWAVCSGSLKMQNHLKMRLSKINKLLEKNCSP